MNTRFFVAILALCAMVQTVAAQDRGPVTNLPIPRYVSLKASEGNIRRGPSLTHRIDWVFKRRNMPLRITAEHGHWRRVEDHEGFGGWVHYSLLSGVRTALVEQDMMQIFSQPDAQSLVTAQMERGVIARINQCSLDWCEVKVSGYRGWTQKENIWGVENAEKFE